MNANELADAMETRASIRRKATSRKSVQENANDRLADQLDEAATMLRQQQNEIEDLKNANRFIQNFAEEQHKRAVALEMRELTDEVIEQVRVAIMGAAYWCADENMPEAYNAVKVCCGQVLGILVKAQEK